MSMIPQMPLHSRSPMSTPSSLAAYTRNTGAGHIANAISPLLEMGAYEALWTRPQASFKTMAELFEAHPDSVPSDHVELAAAEKSAMDVLEVFKERRIGRFGVRVNGAGEYPK